MFIVPVFLSFRFLQSKDFLISYNIPICPSLAEFSPAMFARIHQVNMAFFKENDRKYYNIQPAFLYF